VLGILLAGLYGVAVTAATLMGTPPAADQVDETAHTRYPIVLAHGVLGFAYIGQQSYWRHIPEALRAHGAEVYVTQVSAFNSSEVRGRQLADQVEHILFVSGAKKVNLIGHSHGAQSVRYVAAVHPEWVASVTTVAGPIRGSEVADWLLALSVSHPWIAQTIFDWGDDLGQLIDLLTDKDLPQDARAAELSVSSAGAALFNRLHPEGVPKDDCGQGDAERDGIRYYSWGSVGHFSNPANPADYLMSFTGLAFRSWDDNDGLVGRCASHFGQVIRDDYPMNHFHAINQLMGWVGPGVDPVQLFVEHAQRLKAAGL
jgi:triacylglycerol lipase